MKTLVLGLGNDLIADDAAGIHAARSLQDTLRDWPDTDVTDTAMHGLALLDLLLGYDRAIIIDVIQTGRATPGTIVEIDPASLDAVFAPSPHYAGIPEMLILAHRLDLHFPSDIRIFAIEAADLITLGGAMTALVAEAIPRLCDQILDALGCKPAAA